MCLDIDVQRKSYALQNPMRLVLVRGKVSLHDESHSHCIPPRLGNIEGRAERVGELKLCGFHRNDSKDRKLLNELLRLLAD